MARLELSASVVPVSDPPRLALEVCQAVETAGFDLLAVQDHPYQARFHETWTLLSAAAARTARVRVWPNVANLPLRSPAVLGKAVATLDRLTGGRVELGLGAGAFWDAIAAMGGPRRAPGEARRALREAVAVLRAMWSGERVVRVPGTYYALDGAHPGPPPVHDVGIWLGVYGPRALTLLGEVADGWSVSTGYVRLADLPAMHARIDHAAAAAGRDPAAIRRIANVEAHLGEPGLAGRLAEFAAEHRFDTVNVPVPADPDYVREHGSRLVAELRAPAR
ncbi:MAG TPA: LLM class flavin-dependent oxidoreductase [Frankiaceae bacterium]|nr:LLM class flavin-dependent oxidoreductase [Frankiaceae bacterium]